MIQYPVLKAFIFDFLTTAVTAVAVWLTVPDNVGKLGVSDTLIPLVVGLAGAGLIALRRYLIESKS